MGLEWRPRLSATFLHCILKGLHQSPRIVTGRTPESAPGLITASDISALVIPEGCLGLPTLAALEQGIPVISVKENRNIMNNDLARLPWNAGQFICVENYLEAVGALTALRQGLSLDVLRRRVGKTITSVADFRLCSESPETKNRVPCSESASHRD
jgi:hypothetical protein